MTTVRILVTSAGNEFMHDIARLVQDGFSAMGVECLLCADVLPSPPEESTVQIVIAPHEYGPLFLARTLDRASLEAALSRTYVLNVEQPGSGWFETAFEYARLARGVFDISHEGVAEFRRRSVAAH